MDKRKTGVCFCAISASVFASQYIAAGLFGSVESMTSYHLFHVILEESGPWMPILGTLNLIIGIMYLISAEEIIKKIRENLKKSFDNSNEQ